MIRSTINTLQIGCYQKHMIRQYKVCSSSDVKVRGGNGGGI